MPTRTHSLTRSALFISLGILIPFLFHTIGLGKAFLPMFWPIVTSAFFIPIPFAVFVGILTPILSALITGMPPPPILYMLFAELAVLAGVCGICYRRTKLGIFWVVCIGLVASEITLLLGAVVIAPIVGLPKEWYAIASLVESIPGLVIILIVIPVLIKKIKKETLFTFRKTDVQSTS